jgi:hypothetical protein
MVNLWDKQGEGRLICVEMSGNSGHGSLILT